MITYSSEFEQAMKQPEKTIRVRAYGVDGEILAPTEVWNGDLRSIDINSVGVFLSAGSRMATASVFGDQSPTIGGVVRVVLEVKLPDGTWEPIELGLFSVYQVEYDVATDLSKVTLYDKMMMLSVAEYSLTDDQFPMTVHQMAQEMADFADVTLDPNFVNLPNADYEVVENLWATIQNTNYRDVVAQIAEATGTTAVISGTELSFKQFSTSQSTINKTNLTKFRMGQGWGNVNSVSLSRMPQNDNIVLFDEDDIAEHGTFEVSIINNQIVDDARQTLIQPLYETLVGETPYISFFDAELTTEGHGWYEVGDQITADLSGIEYPVFISEHRLIIDGGIQEVIKSITPNNPAVNKTTAGGILRSLWNTELKVDKQQNEIVSVVSRQDEYESQTEDNFTRIEQTVNQVATEIQDGGGMNQIKNSVGYSVEDGLINFWDTNDLTARSRTDTSAFTAGAISGSTVDLTAGPGTFTQRVTVNPGGHYVISFYAKKNTQGVVKVTASNDTDYFEVLFDDDTEYDWKKYRINEIQASSNYLDITFELDGDVELFSFTDLVMVRGIADRGWYQAVGEVANTNITLDTTGITVKSNVYEGAYTRMTPIEFAGYDDQGQRAFAVNNDTTEVNNLEIDGDIDTPEILITSVASGPNAGMNFVVKG